MSLGITRAMIVVTGGAGFIGSNLVAALLERGEEVVVCDVLGGGDKWRNLAKHAVADIVAPERLFGVLRRRARGEGRWGRVEAVLHMGANASTTETDVDAILAQNFTYSLRLWKLCSELGLRLIYASSAATYGDGGAGFDDDPAPASKARLRPLNPYGWSKHLFDRRALALAGDGATRPPQWAGLKFFNVYGPNEAHKGDMQSVVAQKLPLVLAGEPLTLFRSHHPDTADGEQKRDFVAVEDCVAVMLWLLDNPRIDGLFNVGTGCARSFLDLARALYAATGTDERIAFIDTPQSLRAQYQYFTEARLERLRAAGYTAPFTSLEDGIAATVRRALSADPTR